jgi:hypothetical protein
MSSGPRRAASSQRRRSNRYDIRNVDNLSRESQELLFRHI